ncbi:hypothetical protein DFR30_0948 [Thiogranum longum]|uniref:Uncharacterized protein n=1 Tax=Thiogranum longum TaxID=1537524 RepID=A0A4V2PGQ5_9GAMM|nr:hypothetical protein [Thiogranum longum]TCK17706.1 hypothetical protein DFR30_0948 [Thiogranum longum]
MKIPGLVCFLLCPLLTSVALADKYQVVTLKDSGVNSSYWHVPSNFKCFIKVPDDPTAFCKNPDGVVYHRGALKSSPYTIGPEQLVNNIVEQTTAQNKAVVTRRYRVPEITQHQLQLDSQLLYKQGQQAASYAFDFEDQEEKTIGTAVFVVGVIPNNGAPMSMVDYYGVSIPASRRNAFKEIRDEFFRFVRSSKYDPAYVQGLNSQHMQFLNNKNARQRAFNMRQQQIHQNNMDTSDRSFKAWQDRNAASDRSQQQYVDSIHERRQMTDPNTGTQYQVEGYHDYNYVNPNDSSMSIQTDDALYDPNVNTNQGENYNLLE